MSFRLLLALALLLFGLTATAHAGKKVALLMGNAAYRDAPLANPANDVAAMKAALQSAGFDVIEARTDLDRRAMTQALDVFETAVKGADIGLVFYSGHGIELGGSNYLIPIDANPATERDVKFETIPLDEVLQALDGATRLKLVLLDACRDNPFATGTSGYKGLRTKGLGRTEATSPNMLIAYAAAPGHTALDGQGSTSPFTAALVKHLVTPGLDLRIALGKVRDDVWNATGQQQAPFQTGSLGGEPIMLRPLIEAPKPLDPHPLADEDAGARADYAIAKEAGTLAAWDAFLAHHPSGFLSDVAKGARQKLVEAHPPIASPPPPRNEHKQQVAALPPQVTQPVETALKPQAVYHLSGGAPSDFRSGNLNLQVDTVAISPDGKEIAAASPGAIRLWNVASGRLIKTFKGNGWLIDSLAFSPDGQRIASTAGDGALKIWDVASGTAKTLKGSSVVFSPDGKWVASGSGTGIKLWNATSGALVKSFEGQGNYGVSAVAVSADGKWIVSASLEHTIKL
jgi:Caspase domain/WD domain, G-beta repeat